MRYRNPADFDKYKHTLPICRFLVGTSGSVAPRPAYTPGGRKLTGLATTLLFHDCYQQVSVSGMVWDRQFGGFRKVRSTQTWDNVVVSDDKSEVNWMGDWGEWPDEVEQDLSVHWSSRRGFTTIRPLTRQSKTAVKTNGDADYRFADVEFPFYRNVVGGLVVSVWPERPTRNVVTYRSRDDNYQPPCSHCAGWGGVLRDAPHIGIDLGGVLLVIVFPHTLLDLDNQVADRSVGGFVLSLWDVRNALGAVYQIGSTDLLLSTQTEAIKAWPQIQLTLTSLGNCFAIVLDQAALDTQGKTSRHSEQSSAIHRVDPDTVLDISCPPTGKPLRGDYFAPGATNRVVIPSLQSAIRVHSAYVDYTIAFDGLTHSRNAQISGTLPCAVDPASLRYTAIAAVQPETQTSPETFWRPELNVQLSYDDEHGQLFWQISLPDAPIAYSYWFEDWAALVQGLTIEAPKEWQCTQISYRDYASVVQRIDGSSAEVMGPGTTEYHVQIPLHHLEQHPNFAEYWQNELVDFAPCEIWLGWVNPDSSMSNPEVDLAPRLCGYIYSVTTHCVGEGIEKYLEIVCRDELMRTQAPTGGIDSTFPPLDVLPGLGLTGEVSATNLMGYHAVEYLLSRTVGPVYDPIEEPYARYAFAYYFYPAHQTLIGAWPVVTGMAANRSGGLLWPPPYTKDAWTWLKQIATYDAAMLFWRPFAVDASQGLWQSTIVYANWRYWLYEVPHTTVTLYPQPPSSLPEGDYSWWNYRVKRERDLRRPQEAINRVSVIAIRDGVPWPATEWFATDYYSLCVPGHERWFGGILNTLFVVLPATLAYGNFGMQYPSGLRTCRMLAEMLFRRSNSQMQVTIPGNPYLWWGDKVIIPTTDPARHPGEARTYRIISFSETMEFSETHVDYETTLTLSEEPA